MSDIVELKVSSDELAAGRLSPDRHDRAVKALKEDGVVVLADVVSQEAIDILRERAFEDIEKLLARKDAPFNWIKGNVQQDPAPFPPFLFREVLVNDLAISVTKAILGAGMRNGFYSGNTAVKSENRQPVHADEGQLWPNLDVAHPPHSIVVNLPLVDMGPENGSTEIWPGTHLDTTISVQLGDIVLPEEKLAKARAIRPPLQPVVKAGSIVIRDIRMWHAGMPNRTDQPRPMIAMIHSVAWMPVGKVKFGAGSEPYLSHPDLKWSYEIVEGEVDNVSGVHGYMAETAT